MNSLSFIRLKAIFINVAIFVSLCAAFIYTGDKYVQKSFDTKKKFWSDKTEVLTQNTIENLHFTYLGIARQIVLDSNFEKAFLDEKPDYLLAMLKARYKAIKSDHPFVTFISFHKPNQNTFASLNPSQHKMNLSSSKIIKFTHKTGLSQSGFEISSFPLQTINYHVTLPIFIKEKYVGAVEIGVSPREISSVLASNYSIDCALVIEESKLKGIKGNIKTFYTAGGYSLLCSHDSIKYGLDEEKSFIEETTFKYSDKTYVLFPNILLNDFSGAETAKILLAFDVTKDAKSAEEFIPKAFAISILFILIAAVILYFGFGKLIDKIIKSYNKIDLKNKEIKALNENLEYKVDEKTKELALLNSSLEERIEKELMANRKKDELILVQSKHAIMGEMISMIAHQWRQPLNTLGLHAQKILLKLNMGVDVNNEEMKDAMNKIKAKVRYLSDTIDDFRNFFHTDKELKLVRFVDIIDQIMTIVGESLRINKIKIDGNTTCEKPLNTYPNELVQVMLNIVNNAKDALVENSVLDPKIEIKGKQEDGKTIINICDNAGGIPSDILENIFNPYFSTKGKNGTGLGLYMSKVIVEENLHGELRVENGKEGAIFTIILPDINNDLEKEK